MTVLLLCVCLVSIVAASRLSPVPNGTVVYPPLDLPPLTERNGACDIASDLPRYVLLNPSILNVTGAYRIAADEATVTAAAALATAFGTLYPQLSLSVAAYGAAAASRCLTAHWCDWAIIGREMAPTPAELVLYRGKFGYDPLEVPIMSGSVNASGYSAAGAVIVHKSFHRRSVVVFK
jgi:hypothetical protein